MSNTLNAYPTDLMTPAQILLTRFGPTPAAANEQVHACYQILGVAASQIYPDGAMPVKDIWDRPDGMKSVPHPSDEECKAAMEEATKCHGKIGDFFKTPAGQIVLQVALSMIPALLASL